MIFYFKKQQKYVINDQDEPMTCIYRRIVAPATNS